jgi:predicted HicB family RNase H-like nuclease
MQVKIDVPDEIHRRLKSKAALEGKTLNEICVEALTEKAAQPVKPSKPEQKANR